MAPFAFLGLAVAAFGSVYASPSLWAASVIALGAAAYCIEKATAAGCNVTPTAVAVFAFCAWVVFQNAFVSATYTAAAPYHAAFLLAGFHLGSRAGLARVGELYKAALAFALFLSGWAVWQQVGRGMLRAQALFETPATLTAVLNLVLVPGLIVLAFTERLRGVLAALLVMLSAALIAAQSRGGWLAFACGMLFAGFLLRRARHPISSQAALRIAAVLMCGWLLLELVEFAHGEWGRLGTTSDAPAPGSPSIAPAPTAFTFADPVSSLARLHLYARAVESMSLLQTILGTGYLSFHYAFIGTTREIATYSNTVTYFVHNDYLQLFLELGLPGLVGAIAFIWMPVLAVWRRSATMQASARVFAVAIASGVMALAAHSWVDFPLYIPVCLVMLGAMLGVLDDTCAQAASLKSADTVPDGVRRGIVATAITLFACALVLPVAAEAAAYRGHAKWRAGEAESAAYWLEVARRVEPRDWRYHWYAGQFWFAVARANRNGKAAEQADAAFAAGIAANPREVTNLIGRITTHRQLRDLLARPADGTMLRQWADEALRIAPRNRAAQREKAAVEWQFDGAGRR